MSEKSNSDNLRESIRLAYKREVKSAVSYLSIFGAVALLTIASQFARKGSSGFDFDFTIALLTFVAAGVAICFSGTSMKLAYEQGKISEESLAAQLKANAIAEEMLLFTKSQTVSVPSTFALFNFASVEK